MGFDENGFYRRNTDDILNEINENTKLAFGDQVKLDSHHFLGQFNQISADEEAKLEELAEEYYTQTHVQTATGIHLDRLGASYASLSRLPATNSQVELNIRGEPNYVIIEGTNFETENGIVFMTIDDLTLKSTDETDEDGNKIGSGTITAVSAEVGSENNVPSKSIDTVSEPVEEIYDLINNDMARGGSEIETDTDYRKRILSALDMQPGPTANGLINGIKNVSGVQQVKIINNVSNDYDEYNNPPHSVHLYVLGGAKSDILLAIKDYIGFGIESIGTQADYVEDLSGDKHLYKFDYAESLQVYLKIEVSTNEKWDIDNGSDNLKEIILNYLKTLQMGDTLHFSKLYQFIYQIEGIDYANVSLGTDKANLNMNDIKTTVFQVATSNATNIEVVVNE